MQELEIQPLKPMALTLSSSADVVTNLDLVPSLYVDATIIVHLFDFFLDFS